MNTKNLSVNYYKIEPKNKETNYFSNQNSITEAFTNNKYEDADTVSQKAGIVGLWEKKIQNQYIVGSFAFIQLFDLPNKASYSKKIPKNIDFLQEEGLLYCSPFLFNPSNNILLFCNTNPGASLSSIKSFIKLNNSIDTFETLPILRNDTFEKFLGAQSYSRFKIKVANPNKYSTFANIHDNPVNEALDLGEKLNGDEVTIEVANKSTKNLNKGKIQNIVNYFTKENTKKDVKELEITGDYDDEKIVIDLLTNRLRDTIEIETSKFQEYNFNSVYSELEKNYNKLKHIIENLYENKTT